MMANHSALFLGVINLLNNCQSHLLEHKKIYNIGPCFKSLTTSLVASTT